MSAVVAQLAAGATAAVAQAPTSSLVFTGIRPGTLIFPASNSNGITNKALPDRGLCTANFVFQDTDTGGFDPSQTLYLGAAGHCFQPDDAALALAIAPGTTTPVLVTVGPGGTPRAGRLETYGSIAFEMTTVTNGGDSGAPVTTLGGLAVGQVIGLAGTDPWVPQVRPKGTTIGRMLELSGKVLATCSEATPWPLPGCPPTTP